MDEIHRGPALSRRKIAAPVSKPVRRKNAVRVCPPALRDCRTFADARIPCREPRRFVGIGSRSGDSGTNGLKGSVSKQRFFGHRVALATGSMALLRVNLQRCLGALTRHEPGSGQAIGDAAAGQEGGPDGEQKMEKSDCRCGKRRASEDHAHANL